MPLTIAQITGEFLIKGDDGSLTVWRKEGKSVSEKSAAPAGIDTQERIGGESTVPAARYSRRVEETRIREDAPQRTAGAPTGAEPAETSPAARFYFSPLDEEEIDAYRRAASQAPQAVLPAEQVARTIVVASGLALADDVKSRLERIVASRLRNVRDVVSTKEVLMRSVEAGGVGLGKDQADQVLRLIEEYREPWEQGEMERNEKANQAREAEAAGQGTVLAEEAVSAAEPQERAALLPLQDAEAVEAQGPSIFTPVRFAPLPTGKRPMTDVAVPPRLVGPIDELAAIGVTEWRRLGRDTPARAQKVKEKIDLLAEESLLERAKAVKAWKQSPIYRLYLEIGTKSMEAELGVEQVIAEREQRGVAVLSREEFDAIADLNRSLQF